MRKCPPPGSMWTTPGGVSIFVSWDVVVDPQDILLVVGSDANTVTFLNGDRIRRANTLIFMACTNEVDLDVP